VGLNKKIIKIKQKRAEAPSVIHEQGGFHLPSPRSPNMRKEKERLR